KRLNRTYHDDSFFPTPTPQPIKSALVQAGSLATTKAPLLCPRPLYFLRPPPPHAGARW
ncbi:hypothetical protein Q9189_008242, partial [Teloschistes chrysophthalmus]